MGQEVASLATLGVDGSVSPASPPESLKVAFSCSLAAGEPSQPCSWPVAGSVEPGGAANGTGVQS